MNEQKVYRYRMGGVHLAAYFLLLVLAGSILSSCAITRTETDYYTITDRDTTNKHIVPGTPGSRNDNGIVFPSSRTTEIDRNTLSHDSTHDRKYPNFLRAGGLETAGLLTTSSSTGLPFGFLGIYSFFDLDNLAGSNNFLGTSGGANQTSSSHLFKGELLRIAPFEYRLRWFNDAPDWTIGWSGYEFLAEDENSNNWFSSVLLNAYLRKRFYIHDKIPYVIFAPYLGVSALPSAYVNLGGELQLGSFGGLNLRAYAGAAVGYTSWVNATTTPPITGFPYLGLGMSVMDFTNKPEETEREWKYYVHSAINVNVLEVSMMKTNTDTSIFTDNFPWSGLQFKLANVQFPLPFVDGHFWAGTSLLDYMMVGFSGQGLGVFPIRVGYRQYIFAEDLMLEPFIEYSYYPSSYVNIGARLKLDTYTTDNIALEAGYTAGSPGSFTPQIFNTAGANSLFNFNSFYLGVSVFFGDWNKSPETVKALHAREQ